MAQTLEEFYQTQFWSTETEIDELVEVVLKQSSRKRLNELEALFGQAALEKKNIVMPVEKELKFIELLASERRMSFLTDHFKAGYDAYLASHPQ